MRRLSRILRRSPRSKLPDIELRKRAVLYRQPSFLGEQISLLHYVFREGFRYSGSREIEIPFALQSIRSDLRSMLNLWDISLV